MININNEQIHFKNKYDLAMKKTLNEYLYKINFKFNKNLIISQSKRLTLNIYCLSLTLTTFVKIIFC